LVPDGDEQAVLERVRAMRAEGASLPDIAGVLNGEGVPSKRGARWWPQTVARALG
jgi:hypothetical protein